MQWWLILTIWIIHSSSLDIWTNHFGFGPKIQHFKINPNPNRSKSNPVLSRSHRFDLLIMRRIIWNHLMTHCSSLKLRWSRIHESKEMKKKTTLFFLFRCWDFLACLDQAKNPVCLKYGELWRRGGRNKRINLTNPRPPILILILIQEEERRRGGIWILLLPRQQNFVKVMMR